MFRFSLWFKMVQLFGFEFWVLADWNGSWGQTENCFLYQPRSQFTVMFFGLANSPSTFQYSSGWRECLIYIDDIIVPCCSVEETLQRLEHIFMRLEHAILKLKPSKCNLFRRKITFLRHAVSEAFIFVMSHQKWKQSRIGLFLPVLRKSEAFYDYSPTIGNLFKTLQPMPSL